MPPIVIVLVLFLLLSSSTPPAPPPGNYYPNAAYVPPPQPPLIPVSALPPATSSWRPARPPSLFRGTPPAPSVAAPAPTVAASQALNNFGATSLLNRLRLADAATSPDAVTSALTPFHRGV
jgi:hypothetical protein